MTAAVSVAERWDDVLARLSETLSLPVDSIETVARVCCEHGYEKGYEHGVADGRTEVAEQAPQLAVTS